MLSAHLTFQGQVDMEQILLGQGFKKAGKDFILASRDMKEWARAEVSDGRIDFSFAGHFTMDEYEAIHEAIARVQQASGGTLDDSGSLLGYLQNGDGAYIVTNWHLWRAFLLKAKHKSMEGQKVRVLDRSGMELGTGLLVGYESEENEGEDRFAVRRCTLITALGERSFNGQDLKIEPTGEW